MPFLRAVTGVNPGTGHGEGFIWRASPDTPLVAVDAGHTIAVGQEIANYAPEILVLSHDDHDHIGGAVDLINGSRSSLQELWVPAEWGILLKQIAETDPDDLIPEETVRIELAAVEDTVAGALVGGSEARLSGPELTETVDTAWQRLQARNLGSISPAAGRAMVTAAGLAGHWSWYGANSIDEILSRTRSRSHVLLKIFRAAADAGVLIRYFSIDRALSSPSRHWEFAGRPGVATLANAEETPWAPTIPMSPGLPTTYALHLLMVQNRRALSTLLWAERTTPLGGAIIWSDTDGNWLDHSSPLGLDAVVRAASVSSAPHHASANVAHDRVWQELAHLPDWAVMICAGGISRQSYRADYLALQRRRCCTWCRRTGVTTSQDVEAASHGSASTLHLTQQCQAPH